MDPLPPSDSFQMSPPVVDLHELSVTILSNVDLVRAKMGAVINRNSNLTQDLKILADLLQAKANTADDQDRSERDSNYCQIITENVRVHTQLEKTRAELASSKDQLAQVQNQLENLESKYQDQAEKVYLQHMDEMRQLREKYENKIVKVQEDLEKEFCCRLEAKDVEFKQLRNDAETRIGLLEEKSSKMKRDFQRGDFNNNLQQQRQADLLKKSESKVSAQKDQIRQLQAKLSAAERKSRSFCEKRPAPAEVEKTQVEDQQTKTRPNYDAPCSKKPRSDFEEANAKAAKVSANDSNHGTPQSSKKRVSFNLNKNTERSYIPGSSLVSISEDTTPTSHVTTTDTTPTSHRTSSDTTSTKTSLDTTPVKRRETSLDTTPVKRRETSLDTTPSKRHTTLDTTPSKRRETLMDTTPSKRPETSMDTTPSKRPETSIDTTPVKRREITLEIPSLKSLTFGRPSNSGVPKTVFGRNTKRN